MSAIAIPARPAGHYEFVPSSFKGKSGASFYDTVYRPDPKALTAFFQWMTSTTKPGWVSPMTISLIAILFVSGAYEHPFRMSYSALAEMCCCHEDTVRRAVKELVMQGVVKVIVNRGGKANDFTLNADRIPLTP